MLSNSFAQVPTAASASASTPTGMRSSRIDFEQLAQPPTPVPTSFFLHPNEDHHLRCHFLGQ